MNLLISNDDGYQAEGINCLYNELSDHNLTLIAPKFERSSCGHAVTLGAPVRIKKVKDSIYSCDGYPADCILLGLAQICDERPDLVVSGINHGANLGQDRFYSGTIAAAREATFHKIPAIAVSLVTKGIKDMEHFETAAKVVKNLISNNIVECIPPMHVLNINVPNRAFEDLAGLKVANSGFQRYTEEVIERKDARGLEYYWLGGIHAGHENIPGSDCVVVEDGYVALELQNLTSEGTSEEVSNKLTSFINNL